LGISSLAFARITSSLLVQNQDGGKVNIGLSLKFESKGLKVLGYTRKADRGWEYSKKAYDLIREYTVRNLLLLLYQESQNESLTSL
jgi:5'-3' exoribonuclease 1